MFGIIAASLLAVQAPVEPAGGPAGDNTELAAMFEADQAIRTGLKPGWNKDMDFIKSMWTADAKRRERVRELLAAGAVRTGKDHHRAAYIFQHGGTAPDYLLAHALAGAAMAKGHAESGWIAAATLDRYLQKIGQPQVYGTQYTQPPGGEATMEPYDRALIPDALRVAVGVRTQAEQEKRRAEMNAPPSPARPAAAPAR